MTASDFMNLCVKIGMWMVVLSLLIGFARLLKGPSLADRVLSLDMLAALVIVFSSLYAIQTETAAYLDIAIALALVSFISVAALARYASRQTRRNSSDD